MFYVNNSRWRISKRPLIYFLSKFRSYLPQKPTQLRRNEPRKEANVRRKKPARKKGKKEEKERKRKQKRIEKGINPPRGRWIDDRCGAQRDDDLRAFSGRPGSNDPAMNRERDRRRREERHVAKREAPPTFGLVRERVLDFWNADHWGPGTSR